MAVTINKTTNGYFMFTVYTKKYGGSHPRFKQIDDTLGFFQEDRAIIADYTNYEDITLTDDGVPVTGFASAEDMADKLFEMGFKGE